MARARSPLAPLLAAISAACLLGLGLRAFVPTPLAAARTGEHLESRQLDAGRAALTAALVAAASAQPLPALALDEDEEGFDARILAVLALPLLAVSWALFNVWRVAFRQVVRIGESKSGSSKLGLAAED
eukprot:CAMPEP_0179045776 /NCGR_PEP_ID=MMETSP0796-20121207/18350_1 /TAXON_ID=73915 /ORGANISM="Pyrodinium bahamense, Strain pbaha01" /LENGTH=128 /DNA_ID=CAMNT_0020742189 /DNA_START=62 /DNA_END=448 /DNA_ORIENTATION=-